MKIYIIAKNKVKNTNYFVDEYANILRNAGHEIFLGLDLLWSDNVFQFDIVYFQWPEYIFENKISDKEVKMLEKRINSIKEKGIKIFAHCHNLRPHIIDNPYKMRLYELVYYNCNVMIHMGTFSRDLMEKNYPNIRHYILPHHIYDSFKFDKDKNTCKKELNIPLNKTNILCFGQFRTKEERDFILTLRKELNRENVNFITPSFYREPLRQNNILKTIKVFTTTIYYKLKGVKFSRKPINDDITEKLFCASDIVLIQRPQILNSGNLPMAFKAGKIVIGPNIGNVGAILKETNNFIFDPKDIKSTTNAIRMATKIDLIKKGEENKQYALKHWGSEQIGELFNCIIKDITIND